MGHIKIIVDHDKIDYSGPLNVTELLKMVENFIFHMGFDKRQDKDFEQNTANGKFIEWQISPWKWISDYARYIIKVRVLGYDILKTDAIVNNKKAKVDSGRVLIVIDGFVEYDLQDKWEQNPVLHFLRAIYDNFIYKAYTERFEQRLVNDVNHLHDEIEKFFNLCRHYSVISKQGP
ncbi:MAG: hypothetical protein AABX78_00040 [Nanoarchaeota archaeon]